MKEEIVTLSDEKYLLIGKYVAGMSDKERCYVGQRLNHIMPFLKSGFDFTKKGVRSFLSMSPDHAMGSAHQALLDFLYFAGLRFGKTRASRVRVLEKKSVVSDRNNSRIAGFMEWLKQRRDYSESALRIHCDGIKKYFLYADDFDQETCRRFIATLEEQGLSPKTLNIRICTLKFFGDYLKKPVDIRKRKVQRSLNVENVPTEKEYQKFLDWLKCNDADRGYWIVRLLGSTGMRVSELQKITWRHVLRGEAYIKGKGSKYRTIYFPKSVVDEAELYLKGKSIGTDRAVVVGQRNREAISKRGIDMRLKVAAAKAGFPKEKAHCHAFRHFFAKMYLKKAGDVIQLAELLGHESVDTTRIYLQKSKAEHARDVNKNVCW